MDSDRIHRHFCMTARALEKVGERWSLLIVRDLLLGPRRFTDLSRTLADITPTRLTDRLRSLESAGIVVREPPTEGREVWYRLTPAGSDLEPVIDALTLWGIQYVREPPRPNEPVHPDPAMIGTKVLLNQSASRPADGTVWVWRFPEGDYTLRLRDGTWHLARGADEAAKLTVDTTAEAWAHFITAPPAARDLGRDDIGIAGPRAAANALARAFGTRLKPR